MSRRSEAGFTLIEVLAALLIFSVAIIGLTAAGTESARSVSAIEQKMLAGIVADNVLTNARYERLQVGARRGEEEQLGRNFDWDLETQETEAAGFYRFIVKVSQQNQNQVLIERDAYFRRPSSSALTNQVPAPNNTPPDEGVPDE